MNPEAWATVALAVVAAVGLIIGGTAWFYKRGGQEREFSIALRANTTATNALTSRLDAFMSRTQDRQEEQEKRLNGIDTRVTVTERDVRDLVRRRQ
jgi:uncharacterized protein HemX